MSYTDSEKSKIQRVAELLIAWRPDLGQKIPRAVAEMTVVALRDAHEERPEQFDRTTARKKLEAMGELGQSLETLLDIASRSYTAENQPHPERAKEIVVRASDRFTALKRPSQRSKKWGEVKKILAEAAAGVVLEHLLDLMISAAHTIFMASADGQISEESRQRELAQYRIRKYARTYKEEEVIKSLSPSHGVGYVTLSVFRMALGFALYEDANVKWVIDRWVNRFSDELRDKKRLFMLGQLGDLAINSAFKAREESLLKP